MLKSAVLVFALALGVLPAHLLAAETIAVEVFYIERQVPRPPTLSNLTAPPADEGIAGARLAIQDNGTTGRFLGHDYRLRELVVPPKDNFLAAVQAALAERPASYIVVNAPPDDLLALADLPELRQALLFNAGAADTRLRQEDCRPNLMHTAPSRDMLADALMQYLVKKRWTKLFLVSGPNRDDIAFADAIRASAAKFRLKLAADKPWPFAADMRRTASAEIPAFTQNVDYDVLIVADETGDFGNFILYQTWLPRPVAGTQGLRPTAWSHVLEQWGAAQLQTRFQKLAGRPMRAKDYTAWSAARIVGEAVTKVKSGELAQVAAHLRSPEARFAQFKSVPLSFRAWNGQLRQPIPLIHSDGLVALTPLEGFLHQGSELDTLGIDAPESKCKLG